MLTADFDGSSLLVRFPYSEERVSAIRRLTSDFDSRVRAWRLSVSRFGELSASFPAVELTAKLRSFLSAQEAALSARNATDGPQPPEIACQLLPHQRAGIEFLRRFSHVGLFDDPGCAKTRQAIGWALKRTAPDDRVLIVCQATTKFHWQNEIFACQPDASTEILSGSEPWPGFSLPEVTARWVIINYDTLYGWLQILRTINFQAMIIDECHLAGHAQAPKSKPGAKRGGSRRGNSCLDLSAEIANVCCVSGTPYPNGRPIELEPILVMLKQLRPREAFGWRLKYCGARQVTVNEKGVRFHGRSAIKKWSFTGASNLEQLAKSLETFSIARPKSILNLPPALHSAIEIELDDRREYDALQKDMLKLAASGDPASRGQAIGLLTQMLVYVATAKAKAASELCQERLPHKSVVMCDFLEPLAEVALALRGVESRRIDGSMNDSDREAAVAAFCQDDGPKVLLCSRRATGTGMDGLQHASQTMIFCSLPWTPAEWIQAWSRLDRQGQKSSVETMNLICRDTVDEWLLELVYRKAGRVELLNGRRALPPAERISWEKAFEWMGRKA